MATTRTARLAVSVSAISLTASVLPPRVGASHSPLSLLFAGEVRATPADFSGDGWDIPSQLEGRSVMVRCIPARRADEDNEQQGSIIGRCQFCPLACPLELAVEVRCCPKLFHVLKNAAGFGGAQTGAGMTLMLDVMEAAAAGPDDAVVRVDVTGLALTASRSFDAATASPSPAAPLPPTPSAVVPVP